MGLSSAQVGVEGADWLGKHREMRPMMGQVCKSRQIQEQGKRTWKLNRHQTGTAWNTSRQRSRSESWKWEKGNNREVTQCDPPADRRWLQLERRVQHIYVLLMQETRLLKWTLDLGLKWTLTLDTYSTVRQQCLRHITVAKMRQEYSSRCLYVVYTSAKHLHVKQETLPGPDRGNGWRL